MIMVELQLKIVILMLILIIKPTIMPTKIMPIALTLIKILHKLIIANLILIKMK